MSAVLEARELCAYYGPTQVLFSLGLAVEDGGITTLLGANGAGKTTTLRSLSGMCRTAGDIRFEGRAINGRAMMLRPRLMLLDEPSFGLAPLIVEELFGILRTLNKTEKVSMLLVEQNAALALDLADHAYLIETGRLVTEGPAQQLRDDENIRRAYLGY